MFAERRLQKQSPLPPRKQLKLIADLANYQPIPSIPAPSLGFNYTLSQQRYREFETPRAVRKEKHSSWAKSDQDRKMSTILETQNVNHLFPRIRKPPPQESSPRRAKFPSRFHKQREETEATRQRSLTHDTPMTNQEQRFLGLQSQRDNEQFLSFSRRGPLGSEKSVERHVRNAAAGIQREEEQSSGEEQFEKDAVPGPGTYNYPYSDFDKTVNKSTKASFLSQSSRFPQILSKLQSQPTLPLDEKIIQKEKRRDERVKLKRSRRKLAPFNSKSPRSFESDSLSKIKSPGPQDYSPRHGIEQQLIKKIQRNFKGNFGSSEQRFKAQKDNYSHLGPGSYELPAVQTVDSGGNFYFKSMQARF